MKIVPRWSCFKAPIADPSDQEALAPMSGAEARAFRPMRLHAVEATAAAPSVKATWARQAEAASAAEPSTGVMDIIEVGERRTNTMATMMNACSRAARRAWVARISTPTRANVRTRIDEAECALSARNIGDGVETRRCLAARIGSDFLIVPGAGSSGRRRRRSAMQYCKGPVRGLDQTIPLHGANTMGVSSLPHPHLGSHAACLSVPSRWNFPERTVVIAGYLFVAKPARSCIGRKACPQISEMGLASPDGRPCECRSV